MRTFDQLSQDEQMTAVETVIDDIISLVAMGVVPICFQDFSDQIEEVMEQVSFSDSVEDAFRNKIEADQPMKLAMLHEAGRIAKSAIYPSNDDNA